MSGGAKNYSCKVINSEIREYVENIIKVRGLSVKKLSVKKVVNYEVMVDFVLFKEELRVNGFLGR